MGAKKRLPPRVRAHGNGFRGVATILGRRAYGPTFPTAEQAVAWLESIDRVGSEGLAPLTMRDGYLLLQRDLEDAAAADSTKQFYARAFLELDTVIGADVRLDRIDERAVRHYIDRRKRQGVALQTIVHKELGTLRRIIRLAMASGRLGRDPMATIKMPRVRSGRFDVISAADVSDAIAQVRGKNPDHADLIELHWRTGMRRAEVARIRVEDIDFSARRIFVRGKTNDRYRPIATDLVPVLRRLIATAQPDGRLVSSIRKIEKVFERWKKRLGKAAFSPHVLRHGFVSDLLNRGAPPAVVASLVGHSSLRQLPRYFHASDPALRAALDSLGKAPPHPPPPPPDATSADRPAPAP